MQSSGSCRRLREAYFIALVTPAVKQLEKMLRGRREDPAAEGEDGA
ncbi:MAG: hypothetical protein IRY98_10920 [Alicyclobacillaceae bacterium]|nr:hypothetical protein [Alicyclobacillaceae bacterium]